MRRHGFRRTVELGVGERVEIHGADVAGVPALHDGRRRPWGPVAEAIGFVVAGASRVYFDGDTALHDGMQSLAGTLDVALLPIWGWGRTLGDGHMDPLAAARRQRCCARAPSCRSTGAPSSRPAWRASAALR
jgi:L-ascorbate metabolism protein UlaG (beta-lactamase superfamily)